MRLVPLLGALTALLISACSGSDDEPAPTDPNAPPGAPVPGAPAPGTPPSGVETTEGAPVAPEAPPPPAAPPNAGVFADAPPYAGVLGPSTIDTSGKGNGHLSFSKDGNPAGKACLDCHDGAGKGGAPAFVFAGTVFTDVAGTKPASKIEVRMIGADAKALTAYTDANGNFFFRAVAGATSVPAIAGARSAVASRTMANKINDANCNQCHGIASRITL